MAKYPNSGPFSNGTAPAYNAAFGNNVEQFLGYAADSKVTTDGSSGLSIDQSYAYKIGSFTVISSPSLGDLIINVPNSGGSHKIFIQVGGVNVMSIDSTGNMRLKAGLLQNVTP